uniref:Uncharacterized protein n=1 Tax=Odontella aurita TaxID=265563 RepID=A0A6U6LT28_9STRA|mmetsp:Transcript_973/g.2794  ORF Transcript_973/g.2794 Transcript_973/m.2794 type:complete len:152 (+) Transcript_973:872-1327(+)
MVVHVPSLFVGTVFAGSGFLLLHRELSHRSRLTYRWVLAGKFDSHLDSFHVLQRRIKGTHNHYTFCCCNELLPIHLVCVTLALAICMISVKHYFTEKVEEQYREFWAKAKAANKVPLVKEASVQTAGLTAYTVSAWNKGVNTLRNALNKDE